MSFSISDFDITDLNKLEPLTKFRVAVQLDEIGNTRGYYITSLVSSVFSPKKVTKICSVSFY